MSSSSLLIVSLPRLLLGLLFSSVAVAATDLSPQALAQRGLAAGAHYPGLAGLCDLDMRFRVAGRRSSDSDSTANASQRRSLTDEERAARRAAAVIEPTQVFDNLYFVGNRQVASWVLATDDGLILIDAMNTNDQAETIITAGIRQLGLDPEQLRYLIITHGHGDHYGGQQYLVEHFAPRIIMSEAEWVELEKPFQEIFSPRWGPAPSRDVAVQDGDSLTLGDTRIDFFVTPGHTPGTLSLMFPVEHRGERYQALLWGGTGLNFGPRIERIRQYSASAQRVAQHAQQVGVEVFLSNHPRRDNSVERLAALPVDDGGSHPFIDSNAMGALTLLRDCTAAQALRLELELES